MPESAFTSTGTLELAPFPAAAKTELRPLGGGAAARRDRSKEELPLPELDNERSGSPVAAIFGVLLFLLVAGLGGWWYWNSRRPATTVAAATVPAATTTPPVAPSSDSAAKDSAATSSVPHDSTPPAAAAPVADTTAAKPATAGPPKPTIAADQLDDLLAPIREDLNVGRQRMNEGQYDGAVVRFGNAQDKIAPLARKYSDVVQIRSLRREINEALSQNRAACKAERDLALAHGGTSAPDCP
jgi:hypothetical protein